jgi:AcrR family transcriptional regulator
VPTAVPLAPESAPENARETSGGSPRTRAAALPVEERRAAIVAAALPRFLEQGGAITTREIAQAAGIAEGTIFRVFADKRELLDAVVDAALDPAPTETALAAIDAALPFEARLVAAADILRARVAYAFRVLSLASTDDGGRAGTSPRPPIELRELVRLFERESDRIRCSPTQAAHLLRGLTFSGTHSSFIVGEPLTSGEIVSVLLDGIRVGGEHGPEFFGQGSDAC